MVIQSYDRKDSFSTAKRKEIEPCDHKTDITNHEATNTSALENPSDPWKACIMHSQEENFDSLALEECDRYLQLGTTPSQQPPSIQKAPTFKLKQLPSHLIYAYLGKSSTLPVIIVNSINQDQEDKLL
ncbi:RNA-directed DNA polymerase [Abeliophyllum distichum]|uniref:RNA-directed DNA polymerase n=1 Tax=Abeliophyllum distichum TaxID=126358 RepID=A0ABD1RDF4_9LAMI